MDATGEGPSHGRTGLERAQDGHGFDGGECQFGRHVVGNACESDDLNVESLARSNCPLEVGAAEVLKANGECSTRHGLPDRVGMQRELVSQRCPDEIGAVGIEAFLDQKIDLSKIDHADIHRHLLGLASALPAFDGSVLDLHNIQLESIWIPIGTYLER